MCAGADTSVSSRFSVNSSKHSASSRPRSSEAQLSSLFFCCDLLANRAIFLVHHRHFALLLVLKMYLMSLAVSDVEDELVPELDDNSGKTRGTKFSVLHESVLPLFGHPWFLTAGPLIGISVFFAEFSK